MLDAADAVAFLDAGRVVAVGTPRRAARHQPGVPPRRHPRVRARAGRERGDEMTTHLPVADSRTVRAYVGTLARRHPKMLYGALALHVCAALAALAAPRLLGGLVEAVEDGTTRRPRRQDHRAARLLPARADRADPLRPLPQPGARRAGAGRAPRGLRRQHPRAAGRRRRGGRLRRPADPHQPRRRPARLVGADGAAGVDDRRHHRDPHPRRRDQCRLVGGAAVPARRTALGDRAALVPQARQGRLPARERDVLPDQRHPHRDRRGRAHRRVARPRRAAHRGDGRRHPDVVPRPSATRSTCARSSSPTWRSPT